MTVKAWDLCVGDIVYREFANVASDTWMVIRISEGKKQPLCSLRRIKFYSLTHAYITEADYESAESMPRYSVIHASNEIPV